ncbi:kielin/chordin-like protein, partial [Plakobranchus ocellatus]
CEDEGVTYQDGDSWPSSKSPCDICVCRGGKVECRARQQCPRSCSHGVVLPDECCSDCTNCIIEGRVVSEGQMLMLNGLDSCRQCICQAGNAVCREDGSVTCEAIRCPEPRCNNPISLPGECCPVCATTCTFEGGDYSEGESFERPSDQCQSCICKDESVSCKPVECGMARCSHPARLPGQCCPTCDFCSFERRIFRNQQLFVHPQDMCQQCACEFGTVTCDQTACPVLTCSQPMPMAGSCCPVCPKQCTFHGLKYDDGETFVNPRDMCEDCICRQDSVQCKMRMCPPVDCANPDIGDCCPVCSACTYGTLLIQDGESVPDPEDPCKTCECIRGSVRCRSVSCAPVLCSNPAQDGCCPVCGDCQVRGRRYGNGEVVTNGDR